MMEDRSTAPQTNPGAAAVTARHRTRGQTTRVLRGQAERSIQLSLVRDPAVVHAITDRVDVEALSPATREMIEIATELPALCAASDLLCVAAFLDRPSDLLEEIANLLDVPEWVSEILPPFSRAVEALALPRIQKLGAIDLWRAELLRGKHGQRIGDRSTWRLDKLWESACHETSALELARAGSRDEAVAELRLAAELLVESVRLSHEEAA
jgi:hypothetical protein